jgi:microcompartment protein CcmL/EutN
MFKPDVRIVIQALTVGSRAVIAEAGMLVSVVVISHPHPDVYREVV